MSDVVIQAQSTLFNRTGLTQQFKGYDAMPGGLVAALNEAYANAQIGSQLSSAEQAALYELLIQDSEVIPGGLTLFSIQSLTDSLFPGAGVLAAMYNVDPFGTTYETSTQAQYDRQYLTARAAAQSGPTNVRGGTARQGFELAELDTMQSISRFREIWQNQLARAQVNISAIQLANTGESQRRSDRLRAQQQQAATEQGRVMQTLGAAEQVNHERETLIRAMAAGGEFLSRPAMLTAESLSGQGFQSAVNTSFGMTSWR